MSYWAVPLWEPVNVPSVSNEDEPSLEIRMEAVWPLVRPLACQSKLKRAWEEAERSAWRVMFWLLSVDKLRAKRPLFTITFPPVAPPPLGSFSTQLPPQVSDPLLLAYDAALNAS